MACTEFKKIISKCVSHTHIHTLARTHPLTQSLPLSCSGFIYYLVKRSKIQNGKKCHLLKPGLKATDINNKSTFVWLLYYTYSRVHPVSTLIVFYTEDEEKNNNNNNIENSKNKQHVLEKEVKTPVCGFFLRQSSLEARSPLLTSASRVCAWCFLQGVLCAAGWYEC